MGLSQSKSGTALEDFEDGDNMKRYLKIARFILAGALFGVYTVGTISSFLGYDATPSTDLIAAVGGGGIVALLAKTHIIPL